MKLKKSVTIIMAVLIAVIMLSGCGKADTASSQAPEQSAVTQSEPEKLEDILLDKNSDNYSYIGVTESTKFPSQTK